MVINAITKSSSEAQEQWNYSRNNEQNRYTSGMMLKGVHCADFGSEI